MNDKFFPDYFNYIRTGLESVNYADLTKESAAKIVVSKAGNKLIIIGYGGSAAMASHVRVDLSKAYGIRAINFNEADLFICFANNYGYENIFVKAVEFHGDASDLLILINSSGRSANELNAAKRAKELNMSIIFPDLRATTHCGSQEILVSG